MKTLLIAARTLVLVSAFIWLWTWVALWVRGWSDRALPDWARWPGISLLATGAVLALTCAGAFVLKGEGAPAPFDAPRKFVAVGPYRFVRNPMYMGGLTMLVAFAWWEQSGAMLWFAAAWWVMIHLVVVLYEEPALRRRFGAAYENYCRTVGRWIPLLLLAVGAALGAGARPNLSGEWKLNVGKSHFGALPPPTGRTDKIEHQDPTLKIRRLQTGGMGDTQVTLECRTDGSPCKTAVEGLDFRFPLKARWDGAILKFESKGQFQSADVTTTETWKLSEDGKTLRIDRRLSSDEGSTEQSLLLEKQ
jgi:protein-S-isoprenylcysteine O-methyltransferase Ste14